jgi:predicted nucleic acid-binding protein
LSAAVDASVVIAWQTPGHVFHARAVAMLGLADPPLYLNELNLAEVLVGMDRPVWSDAMAALVDVGFVFSPVNAVDVAAARLDSKLRLPGACVLATAQTTGADTVLTFDSALASAATALGYGAAQETRPSTG